MEKLCVRFAAWDLANVYLSDPKTGAILGRIYPQDKKKNAEGLRAPKVSPVTSHEPAGPAGMAPLLRKIIQHYATTGLPPAYLPKDEITPL
jgi:hypothetical protein